MAKYEADQEMLEKFQTSINEALNNKSHSNDMNVIQTVTLIEGDHYYTMGIIYALLLAEHIKEQLALGNIVDVQLFSRIEWMEMEEKLQEELNDN